MLEFVFVGVYFEGYGVSDLIGGQCKERVDSIQ